MLVQGLADVFSVRQSGGAIHSNLSYPCLRGKRPKIRYIISAKSVPRYLVLPYPYVWPIEIGTVGNLMEEVGDCSSLGRRDESAAAEAKSAKAERTLHRVGGFFF